MRQAVTVDLDEAYDVIEDLQFSLSGEELIQALRDEADELAVGSEGRAAFLNVHGEFLAMDGRWDEARASYREALDDGGPTILHPLVGLLSIACRTGDDEAREQHQAALMELARQRVLTDPTYEATGETLELAGHPRAALRWYNLALGDLDPEDVDLLPIVALNGRGRVRRALGLPHDRFDEVAPLVRSSYRP
jgi:tetratricopeptide (TPR) repeat protein